MILVAPNERIAIYQATVTLTGIGAGMLTYGMGVSSGCATNECALVAVGMGALIGGVIGVPALMLLRQYSMDDILRVQHAAKVFEAMQRWEKAKKERETGMKAMPQKFAVTVNSNSTLYGELRDRDLAHIRRMYKDARGVDKKQRPSARNYPNLNQKAWDELDRLQFVYYPGAKGNGRQWTETGRKAIGLKNG